MIFSSISQGTGISPDTLSKESIITSPEKTLALIYVFIISYLTEFSMICIGRSSDNFPSDMFKEQLIIFSAAEDLAECYFQMQIP